jgi:hypothetical protein
VKLSSLLPSAAAAVMLSAAVLAVAQTPQDQQNPPAPADQPQQAAPPGGRMGRMRNFPPPTNLKVLPKDLTGAQVRDIMQTWAGSLGVRCDTCHVADTSNPGPNGRPRLNYADDSKPDKQIARIMYTMTEQINQAYISKTKQIDTDAMNMTVTCGTCHRGHEMPQEFVIPREERRGGPGGGEGGRPPAGTPPSGGTPPTN